LFCELPLAFARGFLLHRGDSLHRRYGPSQPCKKNIYKKTYDVFGFHSLPFGRGFTAEKVKFILKNKIMIMINAIKFVLKG